MEISKRSRESGKKHKIRLIRVKSVNVLDLSIDISMRKHCYIMDCYSMYKLIDHLRL
jgi:hypothetical protein